MWPCVFKNTSEENRKSQRKVNNICMIFLWFSLIGQFVLFADKENLQTNRNHRINAMYNIYLKLLQT